MYRHLGTKKFPHIQHNAIIQQKFFDNFSLALILFHSEMLHKKAILQTFTISNIYLTSCIWSKAFSATFLKHKKYNFDFKLAFICSLGSYILYETPSLKSSKMRPFIIWISSRALQRREIVNLSRAFLKSSNQWILTQSIGDWKILG